MDPNAPAAGPSEAAKAASAFEPHAFGKYYLVDRIAMGGMAEIFKAKTFGHGGFENTLVIKRILAHLSDNEQFVRMFMDEAKVSVLLQHANIVRIYDFGKLRENYFIAMECVEGKDSKLILRKLAERRKLLPREFAVYVAMEAAKGLDYAHKKTTLQGQPLHIVHRDVSPSNILVSYTGEVKVADFGIVKAANTVEDTDVGMLKGKFEYMSPEQASGKELDRRSDIFSLGIILHEMLTGRRLFKTDSEIKTLERIKSVDVDPPSALNPQVPGRLDEIVMRALAKDPDDRYQDGRELHADLLEFLYPASPDLTQQSLSHFMQELFSDEIRSERERLEEGSRIALAMHETAAQVDLEPEWEEEGGSARSVPSVRQQRAPSKVPVVIAVLAVMLAAAATTLFLFFRPQPETVVVKELIEAEKPTTGSLQLKIGPVGGKVYLDDKLVGEGTDVSVADIAPGAHALRVEAEGYEPHADTLSVDAGERVRQPVTLKEIRVAQPPRAPTQPTGASQAPPAQAPATAGTGTLAFSSSPSGADVFIDGKLAGRTPFDWDGRAGARVGVEYRLGGYETARFSASVPAAGGRDTYEKSLQERTKETGKLSVNVSGGWADVYVDGKKIGQTPIFGYQLAAGTHEIRAKNDAIGLDATKTVTVRSGETASVPFSAN
ncbi:MAG: protein kinase domain-containing protein [Myxococcota bacterium]